MIHAISRLLIWLAPASLLRVAIWIFLLASASALLISLRANPAAPVGEHWLHMEVLACGFIAGMLPGSCSSAELPAIAGLFVSGFVGLSMTMALLAALSWIAAPSAALILLRRARGSLWAIVQGDSGGVLLHDLMRSTDLVVIDVSSPTSRAEASALVGENASVRIAGCRAAFDAASTAASLFLLADDLANIRYASALLDSRRRPARMFVRIEDRWLRRDFLNAYAARFAGQGIPMHAASSAELALSSLIRDYPVGRLVLYGAQAERISGALVLVGRGVGVADAAVVMLRNAPSVHASFSHLVVAGEDSVEVIARLHHECPALAEQAIALLPLPYALADAVAAPLLFDSIARLGLRPTFVFISTGGVELDAAWVRASAVLARQVGHPASIVASVADGLSSATSRRQSAQDPVDRIFLHQSLGRDVHDYYVERYGWSNPGSPAWDSLRFDFREDSMSQAEHFWCKTRDLSALMVPLEKSSDRRAPLAFDEISQDLLEALAEAEHQRWIWTRVMLGWRRSDKKNVELREHPDLVSWSQLDEPTRQKDRDAVAAMPEILERAGIGLSMLLPTSMAAEEISSRRELLQLVDASTAREAEYVADFAAREGGAFALLLPLDLAYADASQSWKVPGLHFLVHCDATDKATRQRAWLDVCERLKGSRKLPGWRH